MVGDDEQRIRKLGWRRILKSRSEADQQIREFTVQPINFKANNYTEIIDWKKATVFEPPITKNIGDDELNNHIREGN